MIDIYSLDPHGCCPVPHLFCRQVIGECGVMRTACQNPRFRSRLQIRLRSPECSCNRKFRHWFLCLFTINRIDDQTEPIPQINQRRCNGRPFFGGEHKTCRVFPVSHAQRLRLDTDRPVCDGWANLQHMCLQNPFFSRH